MRVTVKDHIEIRPEYGSEFGPGLIVTFDFANDIELLPDLDGVVQVVPPAGPSRAAQVSEVKQLGSACGIVLPNLTKADVPLASTLEWPDTRTGPRRVDDLGRVRVIRPPTAAGA